VKLDRKFLLCSLAYAVAGMCLGIYMAASKNHGEFVAHAHILLVGFVVSFVYGLIHRLWVSAETATTAKVQFYLHQLSALVMAIGLLLFYGGMLQETLDPVLAASSIGVLTSAILMGYLVVRFPRAQSA
jgi:putative solute:sodium symporter small subunit